MEERTAAVARRLACADADVRFRRAVLQRKCEELERVLRVLEGRQEAMQGRRETQPTADQRTAEVGQSIQDAIERARKIRDEMKRRVESNGGESDDNHKEEEEEEEEADGALQGILSLARRISDSQPTGEAVAAREAQAPPAANTPGSLTRHEKRVHLAYPRKLKAQVERLQDKRDEPFRFAFCCKVNEHLSMDAARRRALEEADGAQQTRLDAPIARIQVPFCKQEERLERAYTRLALFVNDKLAADSAELQRVLQAPSLPRLFPLCARLKLVRACVDVEVHQTISKG